MPNVILASPGRTQPWPTSDACWSPSSAAIGGAPGSAVGLADDAARVDDRRHHLGRDAEHGEDVGVPRRRIARHLQAGDRRVGRVGDVDRAVRERPRDPRVDGAEAQIAAARRGRGVGRGAIAASSPTGSGSSRTPCARRPGTRRSCGGPASRSRDRPVRRSRGPTRPWSRVGSRSRPRRPCRRAAERRRSRARGTSSAIARASNCTMPSAGESGSSSRSTLMRARSPAASNMPTRTLLVPTSTTSTRSLLIVRRYSWPDELAERVAQAELARVEDAVRVERVLHRLQHAEARRRARRATKRARFKPTPWWCDSAPPAASTARWPASQTAR